MDGIWSERELGEVFTQTTEYVNPQEGEAELFSLTIEKGLTKKTERYDRTFLVKKNDKFKKVYPNDFVYNPMNMTLGAVGFNDLGVSVSVSGYYVTMRIKSNWDSQYFKVWLTSPQAIRYYKSYATGSLIEKQRIQFPTLSTIKFKVPSFKEQQKIGALFKQLEEIITLQQIVIEQQEEYKKVLLQKMFPQKGKRVPEIRIKGFHGEWEEYKLGEIAPVEGGYAFKSEEFGNGNMPIIRISNILNDGSINGEFVTYKEDERYEKYKVIGGEYLIAMSGATTGKTGLNKTTAYINQRVGIFRSKQNASNDFVGTIIKSKEFRDYLSIQWGAGAQPNVSPKQINGYDTLIPSLKEQQKIGAFFKRIEEMIALHQQKLEHYQNLKKALLQRMFI